MIKRVVVWATILVVLISIARCVIEDADAATTYTLHMNGANGETWIERLFPTYAQCMELGRTHRLWWIHNRYDGWQNINYMCVKEN